MIERFFKYFKLICQHYHRIPIEGQQPRVEISIQVPSLAVGNLNSDCLGDSSPAFTAMPGKSLGNSKMFVNVSSHDNSVSTMEGGVNRCVPVVSDGCVS